MRSRKLFEAFSYIDEWYLDIADTPNKEIRNTKHYSLKRITAIALAAALCISLLAITAVATGWLPGLFDALKEKYPQDEALFEAAAQANVDATPEILEIPQLDISKLVVLERYFDGETILIGYDLDTILPDPVVGIMPSEETLQQIRKSSRASRISWPGFESGDKVLNVEKAEQYNLTEDAYRIDQAMQSLLSEADYQKAWDIVEETGWVCVAVRDVWLGDHILINGHDLMETYHSATNAYGSRTEYDIEQGNCLRLEPLPDEVKTQETVTVTLKIRSSVNYCYLDMEGNGRFYTDPDSVQSEEISFELERSEKNE